MPSKNLLIIGAGHEQIYAYELAKQMGLTVIASDMNPLAPSLKYADHFIEASTRDVNETLSAVMKFNKKTKIHGVMTLANDVPLTVARVADALNLPAISVQSAKLVANKIKMKERFLECNISSAPFQPVSSFEDVSNFIEENGFPIILKPYDGRGSRGVIRVTESTSKKWIERAFTYTNNNMLLAEKFIEGIQLSTESIIYNEKCITASISHRNYDLLDKYDPFIIENGGVIPADLGQEDIKSVEKIILKAARALGLNEGTIKGDIVLSGDGPVIIEAALRLSGGYLCTDQIPITRGVDLVKQTIKLALSMKLDEADLYPQDICYMGIRYFFPKPGKVIEISGYEELAQWQWITKKELNVEMGDTVYSPENHTQRVGFVHAVGDSYAEAQERAIMAAKSVKIKTAPVKDL